MMVRMKKWDFALIALVAVLSLLPLVFLGRAGSGARVVVSQNGQTLYTGALDEDAVFATPDGGNTIEIRDGRVRMRAASCPDGLCLHGAATPLKPIVCLPNGVTVAIIGGGEDEPLDAITH